MNDLFLNLATTLAFCQNGREYRVEHGEHHTRAIFTTLDDVDAALLYRNGMRPGMDRRALWRSFFRTLVSPKYHFEFIKARFNSNFVSREGLRWKVASAVWILVLVAATFVLPWSVSLMAIWLPITIFYQMSSLPQYLTEHTWMTGKGAPGTQTEYAERCWGRFFADPMPSGLLTFKTATWDWPVFVLRVIFLHFPTRYAIVVGDMPAHDWHHLAPAMKMPSHKWPSGIYERQQGIDQGDILGLAQRELWGLDSMINHVFTIMSRSPHLAEAPVSTTASGMAHVSSGVS